MLRRGALAVMLAVMRAALAQEPPPGVEHDSWREVPLRGAAATDCLEVPSHGHEIRLSLADLRAMAVDAGQVMGKTAETRLQRIFEMRAQGLLGRVAGWKQEGSCVRAGALLADDGYVIAELLKAGRAAVRAPGAVQDAGTIWMRYLGKRAGPLAGRGEILFHVQRGGEPFFSVSWWIS